MFHDARRKRPARCGFRAGALRSATVALLFAPMSAFGHAILVDSRPAPRAHVSAGPVAVVLRYNSRIDAGRSKLTVTGPNGAETRLDVAAGPTPDLMTAHIDASTPGDWVLRWQVLAVDGHITRGVVPFTVDTAPLH